MLLLHGDMMRAYARWGTASYLLRNPIGKRGAPEQSPNHTEMMTMSTTRNTTRKAMQMVNMKRHKKSKRMVGTPEHLQFS